MVSPIRIVCAASGDRQWSFDTNILIDYLSGMEEARIEIEAHTDPAISLITWIEVMVGVLPHQESSTRLFLSGFHCLPITQEITERAVVLRRHLKLKLPDAIIFATAQITDERSSRATRATSTEVSRAFTSRIPGE